MKKYTAIAAVEFQDISIGMQVTDAMLKKAPIGFVKSGTISRGRYATIIGGTTASVDESYQEALFRGGDRIIDHVMLADVHPALHDAILGTRLPTTEGSLAIVETDTISSIIRATETALKGTPVTLIEIRLADDALSGKGLSIFQGELHDVEAAMELAIPLLQLRGRDARYRILTAPHTAMHGQITAGTHFAETNIFELEGEET